MACGRARGLYICAVARRALALRFSLRPSYDVVRLLIFFGGRTNSGLLQVSGRPELRTVGHFISTFCRLDLDQLFRLGHSGMSDFRSGASGKDFREYGQARGCLREGVVTIGCFSPLFSTVSI